MSDKTRAKAGGEVGVNGQFYAGGQFLPGSELTVPGAWRKSGGSRPAKARKFEIDLYVWEVAPSEAHRSIFGLISGTVARWKVWRKELEFSASPAVLAYVGLTAAQAQELVDRWNAGERWYLAGEY